MKQSSRAPDSVDVLVGKNIRVHRLIRKMSQMALAERLGVTFQQVQKYENGVNRVGGSRLKSIADAFALPIAALFDDGAPAAGAAVLPVLERARNGPVPRGGRGKKPEAAAQRARTTAAGAALSPLSLIAEKEPLRLVQAFARVADARTRSSIVELVENVARLSPGDNRAGRRNERRSPD